MEVLTHVTEDQVVQKQIRWRIYEEPTLLHLRELAQKTFPGVSEGDLEFRIEVASSRGSDPIIHGSLWPKAR